MRAVATDGQAITLSDLPTLSLSGTERLADGPA
jgi:hypothetical protein